MLRRLAWAYGGTAAGLLLLAPVAVMEPDAVYYAPPLILPALGLLAGLIWSDVRLALVPRDILVRASTALAGHFASIVPLAVFYETVPIHHFDWLPFVILALIGPLAGLVASAVASLCTFHWFARAVEIVTCLVGAYASLLLARQLVWASSLVTFGPLSGAPMLALKAISPLVSLGDVSNQTLGPLGFAAPLGAAFLVLRIGCRIGRRGAVLLVEAAAGLALLGLSYRLPGLPGWLAILVVTTTVRRSERAAALRRMAWPAVLVLCLAPVDVSLQVLPTRPHWAPTVAGTLVQSVADVAREGKVVVVGGCTGAPHYPPRWVWVW